MTLTFIEKLREVQAKPEGANRKPNFALLHLCGSDFSSSQSAHVAAYYFRAELSSLKKMNVNCQHKSIPQTIKVFNFNINHESSVP